MWWVQVSRMFSALLQLVNNGNVVILREGSARGPSQPSSLRLQTLDCPHEHFADYRAPSFLTTKVSTLNAPARRSSPPQASLWQGVL